MPWPEPSGHDCGAPWNEEDAIDDDGNEVIICGCYSCKRRRREAAREEYGED